MFTFVALLHDLIFLVNNYIDYVNFNMFFFCNVTFYILFLCLVSHYHTSIDHVSHRVFHP